ncbi:MAG: hypothetical protein JWN02_1381 [Acidobacteria bacterium]|jgi:hypothetical protein|nr:hypothetical protein [Acidobacteriota bacterium]
MGIHAHGFPDDERLAEPAPEDVARAEELWERFGWDQWERPPDGEPEGPNGAPSSSSRSR